jgi:hypothetical protein
MTSSLDQLLYCQFKCQHLIDKLPFKSTECHNHSGKKFLVSEFLTAVFIIQQAHFSCQHSGKLFLMSEFWSHSLGVSILIVETG